MAVLSLAALKAEIDAWVYENTTFDITGDHMNTILNDIVDSLNAAINVDSWNIIDAAYDASANPNYPAANEGDVYVVKIAGKIGGVSGIEVNVGDVAVCLVDGTVAGNEATVGEFWNILQGRLETDIFNGLAASNAPSSLNPFATMADVGGGFTNITWANLLTAIGGSTLSPGSWYHITDAPDSSTTITEAWVQAKDANEIFPDGMCLINATHITNRLAQIKFFMAGTTGSMIAGVYDDKKNVVEAYNLTTVPLGNGTANIDTWLNALSAANQSIKVQGSVLVYGGASTISDYSRFFGATVSLQGGSAFNGVIEGGSATLDNASNANGVYILGAGSLTLDNGSVLANGFIGIGKSVSLIGGEMFIGFSTETNTGLVEGGSNASGDTVNVDANTGTLVILDGSTDITINMPAGLHDGQRMKIVFLLPQAATTWAGAGVVDSNFFPATSGSPYKIEAVWHNIASTWR